MKLIIVIPFCANDAVMAERLCDHIYRLNGNEAVGHVLLVANDDVHDEMKEKVRVTASLAFETATLTVAPKVSEPYLNDKFRQMNNLYRHAALTVQRQFRWPWFWLEPDCVPVLPGWIRILSGCYDAQPKKYMGLISETPGNPKFMARCSVYFHGASHELDALCQSEAPFALATAESVVPRAAVSDLVQYLAINSIEDFGKISKNTILIHGDKQGIFAENYEVRIPEYAEAGSTAIPIRRKQTRLKHE